jgi:PadR family transcriptional regulator, regulatory protein AphA
MSAPPDLPTSAYVILGLLGLGLRSGYEIKRAADESTRHFAAISFRQIYPELKRMQRLGLVRGTDAPTGDRRRTLSELTPAGRAALEAWLCADDDLTVELRHGGILKLFFADRLGPGDRLAIIERIRDHHRRGREALERSRPIAERRRDRRGEHGPLETLAFGLELHDFVLDWCDRLSARLDAPEA